MITYFRGNLAAALETGHVLVIAGKTIDGARDFEVALSAGKTHDSDVQLGIRVPFTADGIECIERNSRLAGEWGESEREENLNDFMVTNPIVPGERFKIYVLCTDAAFNIAINEHPFCTFTNRQALADVRTVIINGDVQCVSQVDHRRVFPLARPMRQFDDPRLEFSGDVPMPFAAGHVIRLTAMPSGPESGWFEIRFTEMQTQRQLFHFNVRFGEKPCVVRNAQTEDLRWNYALEERDAVCPFELNEQFTMAIAMTGREFLVAVNGAEYCAFPYKVKDQLRHLGGLKIYGTHGGRVEVTAVDHITDGPADCEQYEQYSWPTVQIF